MNEKITDGPLDLEIADWKLKYRPPKGAANGSVIFLIHGWTGDERSMWIFASQLPKDALLIAPRAPYPSSSSEHGGFSWVKNRTDGWSTYDDFASAKQEFSTLLNLLPQELDGDFSRFSLIGFSQGTAFNYAFTLEYPGKVIKLAALAGFVPEGSRQIANQAPLRDKSVFIAHGSKDETVPIERGRESFEMMQLAAADVDFCESDSGHKLGANCFSQLKTFFSNP